MPKAAKLRARNQLRIIAGKWRGRKIHFSPTDGLRPTPDRVRETVFNWLQFDIVGKNCLDLFAGSGALGLEALSRGAANLTLVEAHPATVNDLRDNIDSLQAKNCNIISQDATQFLQQYGNSQYQIIFLDPPYKLRILKQCIDLIESKQWLANNGLLYFEQAKQDIELGLSASWQISHKKSAGNIHYYLAKYHNT